MILCWILLIVDAIKRDLSEFAEGDDDEVSRIDELIDGIEEVQFRKGGVVRASEAHTDDLSGDAVNPLAESAKLMRSASEKALEKLAEHLEANALDQTAKADAGKLQITLVPTRIIEDIAEVRMYGNKKYKSPDNWKEVEVQRYRDALCRHLLAYIRDPKSVDEESGIPHYKHMACNMAFICEMERETNEE